jgi:CxxC motif-containing protein (DUF1111 family)
MRSKLNPQWNTRMRPFTRAGMKRLALIVALCCAYAMVVWAQSQAVDPGPRSGPAAAGGKIAGMTANQSTEFISFKSLFGEVNDPTQPFGLGPGFDSISCSNCHAFPATGGSSPASNPLLNVYQLNGATNTLPFFITSSAPVVVARSPFQADGVTSDGHVNQLFTIAGRSDAAGCTAVQPDFASLAAANNLIFRQTTPVFGSGLMELIQNSDIIANMNANVTLKQSLGISGHTNIARDGTIMRFGWKAQARSLALFSGEAYNIEEGVTSELSPNEINQTPGCVINAFPEDHTFFDLLADNLPPASEYPGEPPSSLPNFMRFLAAPTPVKPNADTTNGQTQFNNIGCVLCHTTSFTTPATSVAALSKITANLFSDLLVHHMGSCLADNVLQGSAQGDEFRSAPLWGIGQRLFFLHDGRTSDIVQAIEAHSCAASGKYGPSEANAVITSFNALSQTNQQAIVDFLRSL